MAKKKGNMYRDAKNGVSNVFVGCEFDCIYCQRSFQAQMKRQMPMIDKNGNKRGCQDCYDYKPHFHPERLNQSLPLTKGDEFIWLIRSGDPCFMEINDFRKVLDLIKENPEKTFLIQTKDPKFFYDHIFPDNILLGITLETDIDKGYDKISQAPLPSIRTNDFRVFEHSRKVVTIEPILDFTMDRLLNYLEGINPERVYIGYDTKKTGLVEPTLMKTMELIAELEKFTKVKTKLLREGNIQ